MTPTPRQISIHRNGENLGPYFIEHAGELISTGYLLATDLAWYEGLSDWQTLGSLSEFSVLFEASAPPPTNPPSGSAAAPSSRPGFPDPPDRVTAAVQRPGLKVRGVSKRGRNAIIWVLFLGTALGLYFAFPASNLLIPILCLIVGRFIYKALHKGGGGGGGGYGSSSGDSDCSSSSSCSSCGGGD